MSLRHLFKDLNNLGIYPDLIIANTNEIRSGDIGVGKGKIMIYDYTYTNKYYGWKMLQSGDFKRLYLGRPYSYHGKYVEVTSQYHDYGDGNSPKFSSVFLLGLDRPLKYINRNMYGEDIHWFDSKLKYHNENGPSKTLTLDHDKTYYEHMIHGVPHRENGPAVYIIVGDVIVDEKHFCRGIFHNPNGDAIVLKKSNGKVILRKKIIHGSYIGEIDKVVTQVHPNGIMRCITYTWFSKGYKEEFSVSYNEDGRAVWNKYLRWKVSHG